MKLIDVINQVKEDGNIDDRELICYSQSSITYTKFYVLFTRYIKIHVWYIVKDYLRPSDQMSTITLNI